MLFKQLFEDNGQTCYNVPVGWARDVQQENFENGDMLVNMEFGPVTDDLATMNASCKGDQKSVHQGSNIIKVTEILACLHCLLLPCMLWIM